MDGGQILSVPHYIGDNISHGRYFHRGSQSELRVSERETVWSNMHGPTIFQYNTHINKDSIMVNNNRILNKVAA